MAHIRDPVSILQTLHLSSHSEFEGDSDGETEFTIELSRPKRNGEHSPLIERSDQSSGEDENRKYNVFEDPEYSSVIRSAEEAIGNRVLPQRIYQGSSGSYFVQDINQSNIGVFKPKDEEPYGHLNPKWTKWLHKMCCPCLFGRSCLVPNQGYLSEIGASIVDEKLGLNVVPKTKLVHLSSDTFHYHLKDRVVMTTKRTIANIWPDSIGSGIDTDWPKKVGSFQLFVKGYQDATNVLEEIRNEAPSLHLKQRFQLEFERLVVLDYIIRNTDRGNDNWLVKYEKPQESLDELLDGEDENDNEEDNIAVSMETGGCMKIAAIDNGLAFPFKHPDEWRAYPFYWAWLPEAREPFSETICDLVLDKLKSQQFVQILVDELRAVFSIDKGFDRDIFEKQMSVMRGQILNLTNALEQRKSPRELVQIPPVTIVGVRIGRTRRFIQRFRSQAPFFQRF